LLFKSLISGVLSGIRRRLTGAKKPQKQRVKLQSSNINLSRFAETENASGSESSDAEIVEDPVASRIGKISANLKSGRLDFGALLAPREAIDQLPEHSLDRRRAELFNIFRETIRSAFGIALMVCDITEDEAAALIDVTTKFCELSICFANRYEAYTEQMVIANYALIYDLGSK